MKSAERRVRKRNVTSLDIALATLDAKLRFHRSRSRGTAHVLLHSTHYWIF
jgi:hypothetical protein